MATPHFRVGDRVRFNKKTNAYRKWADWCHEAQEIIVHSVNPFAVQFKGVPTSHRNLEGHIAWREDAHAFELVDPEFHLRVAMTINNVDQAIQLAEELSVKSGMNIKIVTGGYHAA